MNNLLGAPVIAGDCPQRPSSEHRYNRESVHGVVPLGRRHRVKRSENVPSRRQRTILTGRRLIVNDLAATSRGETIGSNSARKQYSKLANKKHVDPSSSEEASSASVMASVASSSPEKTQQEVIRDYVVRNHAHSELLEPRFKDVRKVSDQVAIMQEILDDEYAGDFSRFYADFKADETDLHLKSSHQMSSQIHPNPTYNPPLSQHFDGYETVRRKHEQRLARMTAPASARLSDLETSPDTSRSTAPLKQLTSPQNHRTKGTIPEYGNFSGWSKYRQLNASAMLNR